MSRKRALFASPPADVREPLHLGIPTEPYGFSNNVQGFLRPPTFDAAALRLDDGDEAIRITLVYHEGSR